MRNNLPECVKKYETGIINLDDKDGPGTHWVAYRKLNKDIEYFDSFGNLRPPLEVIQYLTNGDKSSRIKYNHNRLQSFNTNVCGHLCLNFLYKNLS